MFRLKKILFRFFDYYTLNPRALALMRVAMALIVLLDLAIRGSDLFAFYGESGIWPSAYVYSFSGKPGMWSLNSLFHSNVSLVFLYVFNIIVAITFLIGYKTRWSNFLLWILTLSFQNRNLYILQGGDDLLRLLLFWGLFLPWNQYYCIDKPIQKRDKNRLGQMAYLLLITSVYFFSAELKTSSQWQIENTAVYHALSLDIYRSAFGNYVYQFPNIMRFLSATTIWIEYLLPILILWPTKKGYTRLVAFILICVLHVSFGLCLNVGLFYLISVTAGIGLLPAFVFKRFRQQTTTHFNFRNSLPLKNMYAFKNLFITSCIILCFIVNLSGLQWFTYKPKKEIMYAVNALRLDQYWSMFAPAVPIENNWLVYLAHNQKGQQYDIYNNVEYVDFKGAKHLNSRFKSDRWKKLAENVQSDYYSFLRPHYCAFVLKTWNKNHPENKMQSLNLYSMKEGVLLNYKRSEPSKKILCLCDEQ
ncbi:MAG: hypothetical protein WCR21_02605 [Bacteroidota bacterium]